MHTQLLLVITIGSSLCANDRSNNSITIIIFEVDLLPLKPRKSTHENFGVTVCTGDSVLCTSFMFESQYLQTCSRHSLHVIICRLVYVASIVQSFSQRRTYGKICAELCCRRRILENLLPEMTSQYVSN